MLRAAPDLPYFHHYFHYYSTYYRSRFVFVFPLSIRINMPTNIEPLSLPPASTFDSVEQLKLYAQTYAKSAGYAFTTAKSEERKGKRLCYLNCKRAGQECLRVNEEYRIRERSTISADVYFL